SDPHDPGVMARDLQPTTGARRGPVPDPFQQGGERLPDLAPVHASPRVRPPGRGRPRAHGRGERGRGKTVAARGPYPRAPLRPSLARRPPGSDAPRAARPPDPELVVAGRAYL